MKNRPCIVLGAGGHARVLLEAMRLANAQVLGLVDADTERKGSLVSGHEVLGSDEVIHSYRPEDVLLVNGVGSVDAGSRRRSIYQAWRNFGFEFYTVIHPSAVIAQDVQLAAGAQIMAGCILQPGVRIGENTIVNTRASLDHDCILEGHVHAAPGVVLSGSVFVGEGAHIGTGAVIIQGVRVAAGALVAAGAVVTRNVEPGERVMGVPARDRK